MSQLTFDRSQRKEICPNCESKVLALDNLIKDKFCAVCGKVSFAKKILLT